MNSNSSGFNPPPSEDPPAGERVVFDESVQLPGVRKERTVRSYVEESTSRVIPVPQVQIIERFEEVPMPVIRERRVREPRVEVVERLIEIPKSVKHKEYIEVPHKQIVDKIVEHPQYIYQEKLVEVPKMMLQERIIPIPRRRVEETVVEIPEEEFRKVMYAHIQDQDVAAFSASQTKVAAQRDREMYGVAGDEGPGSHEPHATEVEEIHEVPHVQHMYRNVMHPEYRKIPKPIEVPITHYRPQPQEIIIDRNVPVPVELHIEQEYSCPRLEAIYKEIPVPVPITRMIERPVPVDAMFNALLLEAYMQQPPTGNLPAVPCAAPPVKPAGRVPDQRLLGMGLDPSHLTMGHVAEFDSRATVEGGASGWIRQDQ